MWRLIDAAYAPGPNVPENAREALDGASLAIWTTTPWTMPSNLAVAVNDKLQYALVEASAMANSLLFNLC